MAAGQQAAMGKFLAYLQAEESSADQAGANFLAKAGVSGKGSLSFFKKLQNQEFRLAIPQEDSYGRTHPIAGLLVPSMSRYFEVCETWPVGKPEGSTTRASRQTTSGGQKRTETSSSLRFVDEASFGLTSSRPT